MNHRKNQEIFHALLDEQPAIHFIIVSELFKRTFYSQFINFRSSRDPLAEASVDPRRMEG